MELVIHEHGAGAEQVHMMKDWQVQSGAELAGTNYGAGMELVELIRGIFKSARNWMIPKSGRFLQCRLTVALVATYGTTRTNNEAIP